MHDHLCPSAAAAIARAGRHHLRAGALTHHQHSLLQVLLWGGLRRQGRATLEASYTRLADRAAQARATLAAGLRRLVELGLVAITKRRVRITWGGVTASRQATSRYSLVAPATEFRPQTVPQGLEILIVEAPGDVREAQAALARIAARRRAARDAAGQRGGCVPGPSCIGGRTKRQGA